MYPKTLDGLEHWNTSQIPGFLWHPLTQVGPVGSCTHSWKQTTGTWNWWYLQGTTSSWCPYFKFFYLGPRFSKGCKLCKLVAGKHSFGSAKAARFEPMQQEASNNNKKKTTAEGDHHWSSLKATALTHEGFNTVDGWNPAPPGMYETLLILGTTTYQLVQDFSHQQYVSVFAKHCSPEKDDDDAFAASEYLAVCEILWRWWEVPNHQHQHHSQPTKGTRSCSHHLGHTLATMDHGQLHKIIWFPITKKVLCLQMSIWMVLLVGFRCACWYSGEIRLGVDSDSKPRNPKSHVQNPHFFTGGTNHMETSIHSVITTSQKPQ